MKIPKMCLKQLLFTCLQVGFTGDFVPNCPFKLYFSLATLPNFVVFFQTTS